jgi:hypothetical protein
LPSLSVPLSLISLLCPFYIISSPATPASSSRTPFLSSLTSALW